MLLAVTILTLTSVVSLTLLSAVRAYVAGESLWSKGQKNASIGLLRYCDTRAPADFATFEVGLTVPLGDRTAREALDATEPDRAAARAGFIQGGNHPDDADAMVDLFLRFRHFAFMSGVITIWQEGDAELDRLIAVSKELQQEAGAGGDADVATLRAQILATNDRLTGIEKRFSDSLGEVSRGAIRMVSLLISALAVLLAVTGALVTRAVFKRIAAVQQSLRDSDARWGIAAHAAKADLFEWDLASDRVALFRAGMTEVIDGTDFLAPLSPADRARLNAAIKSCQGSDGHFSIDAPLQAAGPEGAAPVQWTTLMGQCAFGPDGEPSRVLGARVDISEPRRIREAWTESEQRLRMLWETAPDAVVVLDESGRIDYANASVSSTFGWDSQALVGRNIDVLQPERLRQAHRAGMARYMKTGNRTMDWRATETVGLHRDGHEFALEVSFSHAWVHGKPVFAGFLRDVETRKRAEAESARLADFVEKSVIETLIFDPESLRLEYANAAARANLGRSAIELYTLTAADLAPDLGFESYLALLDPLRSGTEKLVTFETRLSRANGTTYPAQINVQVVGERNRRVLLATGLDITERVAGDTARQLLLEQLRQSQKMESLGTLSGGIAHDFNNIVGAMLGNVALAYHDIGPDHPARTSIDQINKAALRARELVSQILAFSRQQRPHFVDQALQPIVSETVDLLRASLPARVALRLDMPSEPVFVRADATQVEQVLMNLCTNAWHASKEGEPQVWIGVDQRAMARDDQHFTDGLPPGDYAHLWVTDNGVGMDAATQARIFEPFFTTRPVGEGTGLGLSVVHGIVAAHRGAIVVDTVAGRGTTVHVYLPLQKSGMQTGSDAPAALPSTYGENSGQLLYIDDDELMLLMVERLLQRAGYQVSAIQDAYAALEWVRREPYRFDLVLSDFNMPRMSGLQVARAVAQIRADLPVVIISGDGSAQLSEDATLAGVAALVPKQHVLDVLPGVIRRVLGSRAEPSEQGPDTEERARKGALMPMPLEEDRRLERLRELAVLDTPPEPVFDAIARLASEICDTPIALVSLVDQHRQWFKANVGLTGTSETARDVSFCAHAIMDDAVLVVPDATRDVRFAANPLVNGPLNIRSYAGAPLILPGGERVGTLCVIDRQERTLSAVQLKQLDALAGIASQAMLMRKDLMRRSASRAAEEGTPA
ncbi:MAG: PAS domain S-box protein [Pseudomonadota bacterium]|nr:PAS domain S-box protein [Pseudomonadota bacterium]